MLNSGCRLPGLVWVQRRPIEHQGFHLRWHQSQGHLRSRPRSRVAMPKVQKLKPSRQLVGRWTGHRPLEGQGLPYLQIHQRRPLRGHCRQARRLVLCVRSKLMPKRTDPCHRQGIESRLPAGWNREDAALSVNKKRRVWPPIGLSNFGPQGLTNTLSKVLICKYITS